MTTSNEPKEEKRSLNFIEQIIEEDLKNGKNEQRVHTRFPPEPNGYLHIGHAKSICLNFGLALKYNGKCNLRFDDTNPEKEETEYVDSIQEDIRWLGFEWDGEAKYASDYFEQLYEWALQMIKDGKAYVDDQSPEEISKQRGTTKEAGTESPYRSRSVEENLALFERMKNGDFNSGSKVLRAKVDMASPNMLLRDPIIYRILNRPHHRTGDKWHIYPMYDYAHGESDYIEGITHSLCTLEFEVHRPLYNWFLNQLAEGEYRPQQIEFARFNLGYTVMSKRKLLELVNDNHVNGWDDPRMPTIVGIRRRGFPPEALRRFSEIIGIAKRDNLQDVALLEHTVREVLNRTAKRVMAVLDPVKLVITNYPEGKTEYVTTDNNPEDENAGTREMPFSRELYIEREDFMEDAPRKFFRMTPGKEVRLKSAYIVECTEAIKDADGNITEIHATYDPDSKSGSGSEASMRKVKGTLHWVSVAHAVNAEVRQYDRLFTVEEPDADKERDYKEFINPESLEIIKECKLEPSLAEAKPEERFQFQRKGYFVADRYDFKDGNIVFNRTVPLRDTWAKVNKK